MKRIVISIWLIISLGLLSSPALSASGRKQASTTSASSPARQQDSAQARAQAARLSSAAIEEVLAGQFDDGLAKLREAARLLPTDENISKELQLLRRHALHRSKAEAERAKEYARAVERIRRSMLTQAYISQPGGAKMREKLRKKVDDAWTALDDIGEKEDLAEADQEQIAKLKDSSGKALANSAAALAEALKLLEKDRSEYAETFRSVTRTLTDRLEKSRQLWESVSADDLQGRDVLTAKFEQAEKDLAEAVVDVSTMTAEKPWRIALTQAQMIKRKLASKKDQLEKQQWYRQLIADVEVRGREAVAKANWYDALVAYSGQSRLSPDNEFYKKMLKTVSRHVRVLELYGGGDGSSAHTQPTEQRFEWRELVSGVDADMVKDAISQLDEHYVTAVDFRKMARGALGSIKVLAETPQAAESFQALKDKSKRAAFLEAIGRQMDYIQQKDRVDHLELQLVLNSILRASERTVKIPTEVLAVEFADGFLDELDKFSSMIWPHELADFKKQTMGHFYGVGIQITKDPGEALKVVTPLAGSPALNAGIKTGDIIISVDGQPTEKLRIDKLVRMITGKKGTKVVLRIRRQGKLKPFDVTIIRDEIRIRTVKGWRRKPSGDWDFMLDEDDKIGYIRLTQFTDQTKGDIAKALDQLKKAGVKSLILDLRFNPGGLLRAAARVADEFIRSGCIVSTKGRQVRETKIKAHNRGRYLTGDLVVLVNEQSASAAEIVSGAIKDTNRGMVVGQRSYGKGSVQNVIPIRRHRAVLKLTTAYYYLPSGRCLHRKNNGADWGVDPDVAVTVTPRQLRRWMELQRKTEILQDIAPEQLSKDLAEQFDADLQLNTAVMLLKLTRLQGAKAAA